jgi:hypothetical protein
MLAQVDSTLLKSDESRKHLDWRLCGNIVYNSCEMLGMYIKSFINIYYVYLSFLYFLTVYPCLAFEKYIGTSKLPFRALHGKKWDLFIIVILIHVCKLITLEIIKNCGRHTVHYWILKPNCICTKGLSLPAKFVPCKHSFSLTIAYMPLDLHLKLWIYERLLLLNSPNL